MSAAGSAAGGRRLGEPPPGWSRSDAGRARLLYPIWPAERVAAALERTVEEVEALAVELRLGRWDRRPRWSEPELRELERLYRELPAEEVARRLGRTRAAVYGMARRLGLIRGRDGRWEAGRAGARARWGGIRAEVLAGCAARRASRRGGGEEGVARGVGGDSQ